MPFLIAAVVLVGVLCLFDLLLTFAVLRRLREHAAELERLAGEPRTLPYDPSFLIGRTLPGTAANTEPRPRLVAFFDAGCDTCHEHAPVFAAAARPGTSLAFITGAGPQLRSLVDAVGGAATVVSGEDADAIVAELGIQAFPMFLRLDADGRITQADMDLERLAETAATV
ncbi:hypothetical protein [Nonomuraea insulae]|uniref:Thioredoxin domain-containing protein n=1 Tax=Nonomuraea insulae TaxID=1616787 RepID=A0ABW1DCV0_9ACTN